VLIYRLRGQCSIYKSAAVIRSVRIRMSKRKETMKIIKKSEKELLPFQGEGAEGVSMVNYIGQEEGAPNFVMRKFSIARDGHTPFHTHAYEHVVYVVEGKGALRTPGAYHPFEAGDGLYVAPNEQHQFVNVGAGELIFTCTIPLAK